MVKIYILIVDPLEVNKIWYSNVLLYLVNIIYYKIINKKLLSNNNYYIYIYITGTKFNLSKAYRLYI